MLLFLFIQMLYPDVIACKRKRCAEQGAKQPDDAGHDAAETSRMHRIDPAAELVGGQGVGVLFGRSDFTRAPVVEI